MVTLPPAGVMLSNPLIILTNTLGIGLFTKEALSQVKKGTNFENEVFQGTARGQIVTIFHSC